LNDKKEKTILVSGASGIVGYGILKSLRKSNEKYRLIGTTIYEDSVAAGFSDIFEKAPLTSSDEYFSWLIDLIDKYQIDIIIPSIESDVKAWNDNRDLLSKIPNVFVLLNNPELIRLCSDKWLFYQALEKNHSKYRIPTSDKYCSGMHTFPLLLKPRNGYASKGIVVVENEEELHRYIDEIGENLIIQPVIGCKEEEYTTSAFFCKESRLCAYMNLKRRLSNEGFTEKAQVVDVEGMKEALLELAAIFKPVGPTNFQFRIQGNRLKLLEINPRISSATSIRTLFGYNESAMSIDYFLNNITPKLPSIRNGYAVRYSEDMVFYDSVNL
jgi:carbamoyl-phosphate synthase large subunit